MKKTGYFILFICIFMILQQISVPAAASDSPYSGSNAAVTSGCHSIDAQRPLLGSDRMLRSATSALVYEINSDTLVYAYNPDIRVQPASMAKIMTALLALEKGKLDDVVQVTSNAISSIPEYAATLQLKPGEKFTLNDLLYALLVGSANDAANVIAEHISGSQRAFVVEMNMRAQELGCTNTNFTNASGLHQQNQYTSARDLVKILMAALEHDQFMEYFSALSYWLPATNQNSSRYLATTNYMMTPGVSQIYYDSRVTGGRTGVTNDRERSLITTAEGRGLSYITVVLNCTPTFAEDDFTVMRFGSYEETGDLLDIVFDNMKVTQVLHEGQVLTQFPVLNGTNAAAAGPTMTWNTVLPADVRMENLTFQYLDNPGMLTAPVENGSYVTTVQVWYGNVCLAQSPVVARNGVAVAAARDTRSEETKKGDAIATGLTIVAVLIVLGIGGACVLYFIRSYNIAKARATHRQRSRNRRRSR